MTGSGTAADPYKIYDINDLQAIENDLLAYYELANNIDATETSTWNSGQGFAPISTFGGQLDGKGFKVSYLFINRSGDNVGLFDTIDYGAVVQNLGLENCNITGWYAGALAVTNYGTITNCYTTGSVTGAGSLAQAGGFVMQNQFIIGGLGGEISNCYSTCTVSGNSNSGGFCALNGGSINGCYATGNVTDSGSSGCGGFASSNGSIWGTATTSDCYATGNVTATGSGAAAGFVRYSFGTIQRCYSTGIPSAPTSGDVGGFCYLNTGTISDCYWDTQTSGETSSDGGTGKTTKEMKTRATFTDADWDFDTVWNICVPPNESYPWLRWQLIICSKGNPNIDQLIYQHVERMGR